MDFNRAIRTLTARVSTAVTRGVITLVNDSLKTQGLQVTLRVDEAADRVEHFQPFGVSFHPPRGSELLCVAVGGSQDHLVGLAATHRDSRPTGVEEGEGGLYNQDGWKVFLLSDNTVSLGSESGADWAARADRVDAMFNAVSQAFAAGALGATKGGLDGGAGAMTAAQQTLDGLLTPTKSDKVRAD